MPTYEYKCSTCGHMFELFQSINADTKTPCPQCHATAERMISAGIGLIFKGSGFYITDYKNANSSPAGNGGHKSNAHSGGNGSAKEETMANETVKSDSKPKETASENSEK